MSPVGDANLSMRGVPMTDRKMLIVEDEAIVALDLELHFELAGFVPTVATSVQQALATLASMPVDFALLDYHVGGEDTAPVAVALKELRIPFAVCSGSQIADLGEAFAGVENIGKPFSSEALDETVKRLLS